MRLYRVLGIILLSILFTCIHVSHAAAEITWEKTFGGGDIGYSVQQTTDGGYVVAGTRGHPGGAVYLLKTDSSGNKVWEKTFGGGDTGYSVQQTTDGGYIIAGDTFAQDPERMDVYLLKTDSSGNKVWEKTFGGLDCDVGRSVQQTTDGGYIIAGYTFEHPYITFADVYLLKTDSSGNKVWEKTFGGTSDSMETGHSVQQTTDGGYIIAGLNYPRNWGDVYLIKTDSSGNKVWEKTFGSLAGDVGHSVQQTTDGGYIIAGDTWSPDYTNMEVYLIKTDSSGNKIWEKTLGTTENIEEGYSVQQTTDGGYIIAGIQGPMPKGPEGPEGFADVYLLKTDSSGNKVWEKTFGGSGGDVGWSVQQTTDGGYIIAGSTASFGPGPNGVYLIYYNPDTEGSEADFTASPWVPLLLLDD
jgi:hypothetical protein